MIWVLPFVYVFIYGVQKEQWSCKFLVACTTIIIKPRKYRSIFLLFLLLYRVQKQCQNCSKSPHSYQCWWQCKRKKSLQVCSSSLEVFQVVSLVQYQNYMPEYVFICMKLFLELIKCTKIKRKIIKKDSNLLDLVNKRKKNPKI